jgi:outer membrane protease
MKTIFHVALLVFIFCCVSFRVAGLDFDVIIDGGFQTGTTKETVYEGEKLISLLDWNDMLVPVSAITGRIGFRKIFLTLGMRFAVPVKGGTMEDYDFLIANSGEPSQYSRHDTYLDKDFSFVTEGGYEISFFNWHVTPSAGFRYRNRKWTAAGGYLQYPLAGPWTGAETKDNLNGPVIAYEQAIWFPYGSLEVGYTYTLGRHGKYRFALGGSYYPYIRAETNDTHYLRNIQFYDTLKGTGWNFAAGVEFIPGKPNGLGFSARAGYERYHNLKGDTASNGTGVSAGQLATDEGYSAGMQSEQWYVSLSVILPLVSR